MRKDILKEIDKLDSTFVKYGVLKTISTPKKGWIREIREAYNISLKSFGKRFEKSISPQAVSDLEKNELNGNITLNTLRKAGKAMNLKLVYGFVPEGESLRQDIFAYMKEKYKDELEEDLKKVIDHERSQRENLFLIKKLRNIDTSFWD